MNATDVIAYTYKADVWCVACATMSGLPSMGAYDPDGSECGPCFCGAEVDNPQHCA